MKQMIETIEIERVFLSWRPDSVSTAIQACSTQFVQIYLDFGEESLMGLVHLSQKGFIEGHSFSFFLTPMVLVEHIFVWMGKFPGPKGTSEFELAGARRPRQPFHLRTQRQKKQEHRCVRIFEHRLIGDESNRITAGRNISYKQEILDVFTKFHILPALHHVQTSEILNRRVPSHTDGPEITTQHRSVPDALVVSQFDVTDERRAVS